MIKDVYEVMNTIHKIVIDTEQLSKGSNFFFIKWQRIVKIKISIQEVPVGTKQAVQGAKGPWVSKNRALGTKRPGWVRNVQKI